MKAVRMLASALVALLLVTVSGPSEWMRAASAAEYDLAVVGKRAGAIAAIAAWQASNDNIVLFDEVVEDKDPRLFVLRSVTERNLEKLGFANDKEHGFTAIEKLRFVQPLYKGGKYWGHHTSPAVEENQVSYPSYDAADAIRHFPSALISAKSFGENALDILDRLDNVTVGLGYKVKDVESTADQVRLTVDTPEGATRTVTAKMAVIAEGGNGRLGAKLGRTPFQYDKTKIMMGASFPLGDKHNESWQGKVMRVDGGYAPATRSFVFGATASNQAGVLAEVPPAAAADIIASEASQKKFATEVARAFGLNGNVLGSPFVAPVSYSDMGDPFLKPNVVLVGGQNVHPSSGLGFNVNVVQEGMAFGDHYPGLRKRDSKVMEEYKQLIRHNHQLLFGQTTLELGSGHAKPLLKALKIPILSRIRR